MYFITIIYCENNWIPPLSQNCIQMFSAKVQKCDRGQRRDSDGEKVSPGRRKIITCL